MADLTHISSDGSRPDVAYAADGVGDGNVKSLQSMTETSVRETIRAGVDDSFGGAQFSLGGLLGTLGRIIGGAVELGVGFLVEVANGVISFIGGIADAIASLFGGSTRNPTPPPPPPPIFNPIKTNLEAVLGPIADEVDALLADSAGLGDESTTIQQQMRELIDPENPDSELWLLQDQVNKLNDERNDLQDQMIELNRQSIDAVAEFTMRTMFVPGGSSGAFDDYMSVTRSGSGTSARWRVEALGAWTGEYTLSSAYVNNGNWEPVIDFQSIPQQDADPRVHLHRGQDYSTIINYWVRKAEHMQSDVSAPAYSTALGVWTTRPELTFTVSESTPHDLYYKVTWGAATYDDVYSTRVVRNGTETLMQWGPFVKVGPAFSFQSGVRTRTLSEFKVPLTAGDVVTFETFSDATTTSQRSVSASERKISWLVEN